MKWISVEDKLPENDEWVILSSVEYQMVTFGICIDGNFLNPDLNYHIISDVSHWMPLPNPPEKA